MMNPLRPMTAVLLTAALLAAAEADAPAAPVGLAIESAIALALARNETPQIAAARIERAEATITRAAAALRPTVGLSGSIETNDQDRLPRGGPANETTSWRVGADLGLLRASAWSSLSAAKYAARAQHMESLDLRRSLSFAVGNVFLNALAAERQVVAAERRLEVSKASVADAKARLEAGLSTRTDVTRAELEEATASLSVTRARNLATTTRLALSDLIVAPLTIGLELPAPIEVPSREVDVLHRLAIAYRSDLRALQFRQSASDQVVRAAYGRWIPDVTARAEVVQYETNDPRLAANDKTADVTLSLTASWMLYDGGDRGGAIAEAQADGLEVRLGRTRQLRLLPNELRTALADLETAESSLLQAEARDRLARANADEVRARYRQGLATALEDADAISGQFDAESGLVSARLELSRSQLNLRQTAGLWPLSDREPMRLP